MVFVMFYKLKCIILYVLHAKTEIVRNGISNRMLNGKMPKVAGKKDSMPETLPFLLSCGILPVAKNREYIWNTNRGHGTCLAQLFL